MKTAQQWQDELRGQGGWHCCYFDKSGGIRRITTPTTGENMNEKLDEVKRHIEAAEHQLTETGLRWDSMRTAAIHQRIFRGIVEILESQPQTRNETAPRHGGCSSEEMDAPAPQTNGNVSQEASFTEEQIDSVWGVHSQTSGKTWVLDVAMVNAICRQFMAPATAGLQRQLAEKDAEIEKYQYIVGGLRDRVKDLEQQNANRTADLNSLRSQLSTVTAERDEANKDKERCLAVLKRHRDWFSTHFLSTDKDWIEYNAAIDAAIGGQP